MPTYVSETQSAKGKAWKSLVKMIEQITDKIDDQANRREEEGNELISHLVSIRCQRSDSKAESHWSCK